MFVRSDANWPTAAATHGNIAHLGGAPIPDGGADFSRVGPDKYIISLQCRLLLYHVTEPVCLHNRRIKGSHKLMGLSLTIVSLLINQSKLFINPFKSRRAVSSFPLCVSSLVTGL